MKFIFIFIIFPCLSYSQIITTIAGNGNAFYSGDNGLAISAGVYFPVSVCTDSIGNLFIVEQLDYRIRRVDVSTGVISTFVGNGIAGYNGDNIISTNAQLNYPIGIITDTIGNFYIADGNNNRIRKVNTNGLITTIAGNGVPTYSGDSTLATLSSIYSPTGITIDRFGNIAFSDNHNNRIRKISSIGIISTIAGNGIQGYYGDNGLANNAQINSPIGISVDTLGNFYFIDYNNSRLRKISMNNNFISTICGTGVNGYNSDGILSNIAQINQPRGVFVDKNNDILIADAYNNRIRKINVISGIISTVAGTGIAGFSGDGYSPTIAKLNGPSYVYADRHNDYYITDGANHRVRKIINSFPINALPSNIICSGTSVTFEAGVISACTSPSYQWSVNGVNVGTNSATFTYIPLDGDTISCIMMCIGGGSIHSRPVIMQVDSMNHPYISLTGTTSVSVGNPVTINATVTNAGSTYYIIWMNHGVTFATTNVPPASGNGTTYTKGAGTDSISAKVVVTGGGCYDSATTATYTTVTTTVGISNINNANDVQVYPNPTNNLLHIDNVKGDINYRLQNIVGQCLQIGILQQANNKLNVHELPAGIYLLELTNTIGQREVVRVVKE